VSKTVLSTAELIRAARCVANALLVGLEKGDLIAPVKVFGIPRGGVSASYLLASLTNVVIVDTPEEATVILDDLIDSGATMFRYMTRFPDKTFAALLVKGNVLSKELPQLVIQGSHAPLTEWLVFPWEQGDNSHDHSAEDSVTRMMQAIGEDVTREGLRETPKRVVKAWGEWFSGYRTDPASFMKTFEDGAQGVDEMILLDNIPVHSFCEHHITPFIGVAHVAYIPNGRIVGISKIARVVDTFSRRLQVQERLTNQIANCLQEHLDPLGVAVVVKAKHLCMATRGIKMPNVSTVTSAMRGAFLDKPEARAEFMSLIPRD